MYEPNSEVGPTGAEVDEFVDVPEPRPSEPPRRDDVAPPDEPNDRPPARN
jgi:hypothetical protein